MADQMQLKRLLASVEEQDWCITWNKWREENENIAIDLSKADLGGINLRFANLSKANLTQADLSGTDLEKADLRQANFEHANLEKANLTRCYLTDTLFKKANLYGANLSYSKVAGSDFCDANLSLAILKDVKFLDDYRIFDENKLSLSRANLSSVDLSGAILNRLNLSGADLRGACLIRSELCGVNLSGARLFEANLKSANLALANLDGAFLSGCLNYRLDNNSIRLTKFAPRAADPYSVLRRTYTGIMFTLVLIFTLMALAPFAFKAISYSFIGKFQNEYMSVNCDNPSSIDLTCERTLSIVLGFTEESESRWLGVAVAILVLVYNVTRYIVTLGV